MREFEREAQFGKLVPAYKQMVGVSNPTLTLEIGKRSGRSKQGLTASRVLQPQLNLVGSIFLETGKTKIFR
jgi:hypothetical protein